MSDVWHAVGDDALSKVNDAAKFLMEEFCPLGADPIWSGDYFRWKLGSANPAGSGFLSLAISGGRVVGTVSVTRKRLWLDGHEHAGGEVGDCFSSPSVRLHAIPADLSLRDPNPKSYVNRSIFGRLASETEMRATAAGVSLIYGTSNRNAYPGWTRRLGYQDRAEFRIRSFVHPTANYVASIHRSLSWFRAGFLAAESVLLGGLRQFRRLGGQTLSVERGTPSPGELGELWQRTRPTAGFSLVRDAAYWSHRYREHPLATYEFFLVRKRNRLCGVVVTRCFLGAGNRRHLSFLEWMNEEDVPFARVVVEILYAFRADDIDIVSLYAREQSAESGALRRSFFLPRSRIPIIFADTPLARGFKCSPEAIEFYIGSSDAV